MTWGDIGAIFAVLVVGSFIAGAVDTWREERKREKNKRGGEIPFIPSPLKERGTPGVGTLF